MLQHCPKQGGVWIKEQTKSKNTSLNPHTTAKRKKAYPRPWHPSLTKQACSHDSESVPLGLDLRLGPVQLIVWG